MTVVTLAQLKRILTIINLILSIVISGISTVELIRNSKKC